MSLAASSENLRNRAPALSNPIHAAFLGLAMVLCGVGIGQGGLLAYLTLGLALGAVVFFVFGEIQFPVLIAWIVLTALAYPFLRFPGGRPIVTFDRVWIAAMVGCLMTARTHSSTATRVFCWSLAWLTVAYGVRMVFTQGSQPTELVRWVDALVLPGVVFLVTRRLAVTPEHRARIGGALAVAGSVLATIGIAESILGFELASRSGGEVRFDSAVRLVRISGPYAVPEVYALSLTICLAGTLYWTLTRRRYVLGAVVALMQASAIGLALFRAFWIAGFAVVVITIGLRPNRVGRVIVTTVGVVVVLALLLSLAGVGQALSTRVHNTKNIAGRFAVYGVALELFERSPLFGVGVDRFVPAQASLPSASLEGARYVQYPHSSYLAVLAEQGVVGFAPLIAASGSLLIFCRRLRQRAVHEHDVVLGAAVTAASLAYLFVSFSLTMLPYGSSNAFLAVLLGAAAASLDASEDPGEDRTSVFSLQPVGRW